ARLEALCADLGVPLLATQPISRKRYIWRAARPRRWPLTVSESLRLGGGLLRHLGHWRPQPRETVTQWGERVLGKGATHYALAPVLSGIYAGDAQQLSAGLIFNRRSNSKDEPQPKPQRRGTVAPRAGMQQLLDALADYLQSHEVEFVFNQAATVSANQPTVICTAVTQAAELLREIAPTASEALRRVELLPLLTATVFYERQPRQPQGFGCPFPRGEGFRARGVLFNDCIFAGRSEVRSETWILGGALDRTVLQLSDDELRALLKAEHALLVGTDEEPLSLHITSWPQALPHYTLDLEQALADLPPLPKGVALAGNYLGQIGLAKLAERAARVAREITESL
ncbi:MAG: FAD-dependent oxidoreductase, partial [Deltaproteobacteria bacterium]|nr:FAD-dependent oxidoreductase [Deltaproteobacteria bacterium]